MEAQMQMVVGNKWQEANKQKFEFRKAKDTSKAHNDLHCVLGVSQVTNHFGKEMMLCKFTEDDVLNSSFGKNANANETIVKYDKEMGDMWCSQPLSGPLVPGDSDGDVLLCTLHNEKMPLQPFFDRVGTAPPPTVKRPPRTRENTTRRNPSQI